MQNIAEIMYITDPPSVNLGIVNILIVEVSVWLINSFLVTQLDSNGIPVAGGRWQGIVNGSGR